MELWFEMAEWIRSGGSLPNVPELIGELTPPTYTFVNGRFQLEDKDHVKARLGRSPDLADALAVTFAVPEPPPKRTPPPGTGRREMFRGQGGPTGRERAWLY